MANLTHEVCVRCQKERWTSPTWTTNASRPWVYLPEGIICFHCSKVAKVEEVKG